MILGRLPSNTSSDYYRRWQVVSDYPPWISNEVVISKLLIQITFRIVSLEEREDVVPGRLLSPVVSHCHAAGLSAVVAQKESSRYTQTVWISGYCVFVFFYLNFNIGLVQIFHLPEHCFFKLLMCKIL